MWKPIKNIEEEEEEECHSHWMKYSLVFFRGAGYKLKIQ